MKIHPNNEYAINKYKIAILLVGVILSNIFAVFLLPFFIFKNLFGITMPLYYILTSLLSIVLIGVLGFNLDNCYLKACKKVEIYAKEIEYKNSALIHMYNELKTSKENLDKFSEELEKKVFEKTESIQNLLNNAGQGFLSFGIDLKVNKDYSFECIRIFNQDINGKNICQLIFPYDKEMQELIRSVTYQIINEKENPKREIYLSLLPNEASIEEKQIKLEYKIIYNKTETIMLILTDITEKRKLQTQMETEKNTQKMIVNIVRNYSDFMYCLKDYENFCQKRIYNIFNTSYSIEDIVLKVYRSIHTFKGNFGQFGLIKTTSNLHHFEYELSELLKCLNNMSLEDLESNLLNHNMLEWIKEDLDSIENILGDFFFRNNEVVEIDKQKLIELENKMLFLLSPLNCSMIIPDIKKFRHKPFKDLIKSYTNYILGLSDRFNKQLNPLEILGGDFFVDPEKYSSFAKSLGHVFRDIMEYGIEPFEERIRAGKSELGNIKCTAELSDNTIKLTITDDGHGIDVDLIKNTAVEKGYYTAEEINTKKDDEIISLIFCDGFSTNCDITNLSGRGMGLSAVKDEVDNLGGTVKVNTLLEFGTTFTFLIPLTETTDLPLISEDIFMNSLLDTTKNFFVGQVFLSDANVKNKINKVANLTLREVSVLIDIKGAVNGTFIFTADKSLLETVLLYFDLEPSNSDDEEISTEDVLAECTNMIMGNFLKSIPHIEDHISLGTPITLYSKETKIKHVNPGIYTALLESEKGNIEINYINSLV